MAPFVEPTIATLYILFKGSPHLHKGIFSWWRFRNSRRLLLPGLSLSACLSSVTAKMMTETTTTNKRGFLVSTENYLPTLVGTLLAIARGGYSRSLPLYISTYTHITVESFFAYTFARSLSFIIIIIKRQRISSALHMIYANNQTI